MCQLNRNVILSFVLAVLCFSSHAQNDFVKVTGHQFTLKGKPYYFIGSNYWYGSLLAGVKGDEGKARLQKELDALKKNGINNLRVLVGAEGTSEVFGHLPYGLQPEQGKYDEVLFKSLDFFLTEIGKRQMKAVMYLTNNWDWSGGFSQYVAWNKSDTSSTDNDIMVEIGKFYSCDPCTNAANEYIKTVIQRTNSITGKKYSDDASIMAWELANEPRPINKANEQIYQQWIQNTSALIKSIDRNHLVTTGAEGEMGTNKKLDLYEKIHSYPSIDYLTIHIWPKNWGWFDGKAITESLPKILNNTQEYIQQHIDIANKLNKPLVVEEFGLPRDEHAITLSSTTKNRDAFYELIFDLWKKSKTENGTLNGVNFWGFGGNAKLNPAEPFWKKGADFTADPGTEEQGLNSVFMSDESTLALIRNYTTEKKTSTK